IGGSFASNANLNGGDMSVGGAVSGDINNNGGVVTIGGPISGNVNSNNGGSTVIAPVAAPAIAPVPVADVAAAMTGLAADLAALADTGGTANIADQNNINFASVAGADGIAVFNVSGSFLQSGTFTGFTAAPGVTTIVNVSGSSITVGANLNTTFSNVLFNFFEAETLNIDSAFNVSILAPLADLRLQGGGINGTVVSRNLFQSAEIRPGAFTGDLPGVPVGAVPLPASGLLLLGAMGLLGFRARRRAA
ncbi:MAG: collagen-binding domain-containing protein, partial [Paracoccaceae bacterium]